MSSNRKPVLYKGEIYTKSVVKTSGFGGKSFPSTYDQVREKIIHDIDEATSHLRELPSTSRLPNEMILCMRMHPDFSAKSYYPTSLFDGETERFGLQEIGSRIWKANKNSTSDDTESRQGKLFFVRGTESSLNNLKNQLNKPESNVTKSFTEDVRKLVSVDLLTQNEQILGIPDDWEEGRLEAVLHPFNIDQQYALQHFFGLIELAGVDLTKVRHKQYEEGITFISLYGDRDVISMLSGYNPLRTLHPLNIREFAIINRGTKMTGAPRVPLFTKRSDVIVGVVDGGYNLGNAALDPYVDYVDSVFGPSSLDYSDHGTQVTSAVLYGGLNIYKNSDQLPEPSVSVKNFRVLSTTTNDPDLYEVIDAIEQIVPINQKIKVYNLSLGPCGPILDDHISRFTFACDTLSYNYDVLFCTAVGNDGEMLGYNRIQAPSDMVNGLAVGAYTKNNGNIERASYSCVGPGREGNKLKPDISAFGGCAQMPIHLMNHTPGTRIYNMGTSFSSPLVSSVAGQLIGFSENVINPLISRALLIHGASESGTGHNTDLGHGVLPENIQTIVTCPEKSYTLIYNGEIQPGKYIELPIPWTDEIQNGKAMFRWTVAVQTKVDPQSPDDYPTSSVVTAFYPNASKYNFTSKSGATKKIDVLANPTEASTLIADGWKQGQFPITDNGENSFQVERDLKADLKWDSLDSRSKTKHAKNIKAPMFHLHALDRGQRYNGTKIKYALILTVQAPASTIDLYSKILTKYSALMPVNLKIESVVSTSIST